MADDGTRAWNRFNSEFRIPESEDAARVANEVRAAVDAWVQNSLAQLEADMSRRASVLLAEFDRSIAESRHVLHSAQQRLADLEAAVNKLTPGDPGLAQAINTLKEQTKETRKAMQAAAEKWEDYGKKSLATAMSIAKTVATFA